MELARGTYADIIDHDLRSWRRHSTMIMQPISAKSLDPFTSRSKIWSWVYVQASLALQPVLPTTEILHGD
jgi:hypothetical protein